MSAESSRVSEFRGIVESVVKQHPSSQRQRQDNRQETDYLAEVGVFTYGSYDLRNNRSTIFGISEHVWGVHTRRRRIGRYTGIFALISTLERPVNLTRRWTIENPLDLTPTIGTSKVVNNLELMTLAVKWASSPSLETPIYKELAELEPAEELSIARRWQDLADKVPSLQKS